MLRIKAILVFVLLFWSSTPSLAAEVFAIIDSAGKVMHWSNIRQLGLSHRMVSKDGFEFVGLSDVNDTVFLQTESISKKGKYLKAWFLKNYSDEQQFDGIYPILKYSHILQLSLFDCEERTMVTSQQIFYLLEKNVNSVFTEDAKLRFAEVAPGTIGEIMLTRMCRKSAEVVPPGEKQTKAKTK